MPRLSCIVLALLYWPGVTGLNQTEGDFRRREGLAVVGLGWSPVTAFGALPLPLVGNDLTYTDAF